MGGKSTTSTSCWEWGQVLSQSSEPSLIKFQDYLKTDYTASLSNLCPVNFSLLFSPFLLDKKSLNWVMFPFDRYWETSANAACWWCQTSCKQHICYCRLFLQPRKRFFWHTIKYTTRWCLPAKKYICFLNLSVCLITDEI